MADRSAPASYKKEKGVLTVSNSYVTWKPNAREEGVIEERLDLVNGLFSSPPATGKYNLKITFYPPSQYVASPPTFTFTAQTAATDAADLKTILASIAAKNKTIQPQQQTQPTSAAPSPASSSKPTSSKSNTPNPANAPPPSTAGSTSNAKGKGKAVPEQINAVASTSAAPSPGPPGNGTVAGGGGGGRKPPEKSVFTDWELHKRVLVKNPQLASLHYELVQAGQLSDAEFWQGRELMLLSEQASSSQSAGRSSQLIDDRWSSKGKGKGKDGSGDKGGGGGGAGTISLTPELIRDIFDEFPEVQEAYGENVPHMVGETDFWSRYFNSRLWERHRASVRSSKLGTAKADEMFDKYLEAPDDDLVPRHDPGSVVNRFLDLAATEEDHNETGNSKDITMQAGKQRSSLPLMRRFNEHSEKLLRSYTDANPPSALPLPNTGLSVDGGSGVPGDGGSRKRAKYGTERDEMRRAELDFEDLHASEGRKEIPLDMEMQDRQKYFEGRSGSGGAGVAGRDGGGGAGRDGKIVRDIDEINSIINRTRASFVGWQPTLETMRLEKKAAEEAMLGLTQSVKARVDAKSNRDDIPPDILKLMISTHTATCEFLRQFWQAVLPPPATVSSSHILNQSTPTEKAAKAEKMVRYLGGTEGKVDGVVEQAKAKGASGEKVMIALRPTLDSVQKALAFYQSRRR